MNKYLNALKSLLLDAEFRIDYLTQCGFYDRMSDEKFIRKKYKIKMGKPLSLDPPVTYSEKLQWIKLHDHNPLYTTLVDKYTVKEYVAEKIGKECRGIPGVWHVHSNDTRVLNAKGESILSGVNLWDLHEMIKEVF